MRLHRRLRACSLLAADASRAPFAAGAFDTVITPWLVDILDEDFAVFAARLNQWLKPGGRWVNSGSLFFQHRDPERCYSTDELGDLLGAAGFGSIDLHEESVTLPRVASQQARAYRGAGHLQRRG